MWAGLYTSPLGTFLSKRTIVGHTRKVPERLNMEGRENDYAIKRSIGK